MRTMIGWMAALLGSALLGATVYQTVLSRPQPELDPAATVETITQEPGPQPTLYRTEVRTVVEPTPTVTVEDEVLIREEAVQVSQPRTANPAPARSSAPKPKPKATAERDDADDEAEAEEESSDDDAAGTEDEDDSSGEGSDDD